ncbi:MAG: energy-coupled thiamine transporter ThiT [Nitrososphaerales archaeon]
MSGQSGIVKRMDARVLAEVAIMTALASVLYATKVFTLPQGGSITLGSMVPIFLISFRRGPKVGILTGVIFSLVVLYLEPFVYNPIQFLLDYPLAFGSLGLAGFFRSRLIVGVGVGIGARFICHFFSGLIFFASYAPAGESPALYSAIYNASYLIPEFFISAIVIYALAKRNILTVGIPVKPSRTQA